MCVPLQKVQSSGQQLKKDLWSLKQPAGVGLGSWKWLRIWKPGPQDTLCHFFSQVAMADGYKQLLRICGKV